MKKTLLTLIVVALMALPATATAEPNFTAPPTRQLELHLNGSNGYRVRIIEMSPRTVYVTAHDGPAAVEYSLQGKKTDEPGIEAKLPGVGRISLTFRPRGKAGHLPVPDNCKGRATVVQHGVFVGTLRLHGERGYTEVGATRARGSLTRSFMQSCDNSGGGGSGGGFGDLHTTFLSAISGQGRAALSFQAIQVSSASRPDLDQTFFSATSLLARNRMFVGRSVQRTTKEGALQIADPIRSLGMATVAPPGPFSGSASFQLTSKSSATWTGLLSVELPGAGEVALAGPSFSARLCRDSRCVGEENGESVSIAISPRLAHLYGSGSQSQAFWDARLSWSR